jgi:hypothetical protein
MNDRNRTTVETRSHPGRLYLGLGVLLALAGVAIYYFQLGANVLITPWYMPTLATAGVVFIVLALVRSRSVWRWAAVVLCTLFAAAQWVMLLVVLAAPPYTGSVKAGQPFPEFTTTLADGSTFNQDRLKGDQNTVMVFYRGHW